MYYESILKTGTGNRKWTLNIIRVRHLLIGFVHLSASAAYSGACDRYDDPSCNFFFVDDL